MAGNEIATRAAADLLDGPANDQADALADSFMSTMEDYGGGTKVLPVGPTLVERKALQDRLLGLKRQMRPLGEAGAEKDRLVGLLTVLMQGYPSTQNADAQSLLTAYVSHLQDLPLFAVRAAIDDVQHRRVPGLSPDFAPSSARIYEEAERHLRPIRAAKVRAEMVLTAKIANRPPSPEFAATAQEKLRDLANTLRTATAQREILDASERAARADANGRSRIEGNTDLMRREYARRGIEPVYSNGVMLSPWLVEQVLRGDADLAEARTRFEDEAEERSKRTKGGKK